MPYIGRSTDGFGVRNRFIYLASSGDTSVSGADANGATLTFTDGAYVDVYLNGVLLKPTTDYNTSTANTIAGLSALNTNDEITVVVYDVFTVADMVSATSGGTFSGAVTVNGAFTSVGIDDNADALAMTIDSSENVGIGTTSPTSPLGTNFKVLDINSGVWGGNVNFSGNSGGYIGNRHSGNGGLGYYSASGQGHDFHVNGNTTSVLNINSSGAVTMPSQPRLSVYQYSAQTISHNTYTKLKLDGTDSITNGFTGWTQSNTHTRWTTATAGTYRIHASMRWFTNSAISTSAMYIYKNGSTITFGYDHSLDNYAQLHAMTIHDLSASDYLEVVVYQYSGGDVAMNGGSANLVRLTADLIA